MTAAPVALLALVVALAMGSGSVRGVAVAWLAFAAGAWVVLRAPVRFAVWLILAGAVAVQLAAGLHPASSSDDLYRYLWDARVQAAGIDPYRYAPAAPQLAPLREEQLWPDQATWCVPAGSVDAQTGQPLQPGCTRINRPTVHTIYPPVAQAIFRAVSPLPPTPRSIQVVAMLFAVGTTVLLLAGLRWRGRDPRRAVLWAWCPLVAIEAGSNAHIDVAAAGLTAAALLLLSGPALRRGTAGLGGVLLGLAVATKMTPAAVLPAVLRRRPITVLLAAAAAVVAVYLPHLFAVGGAVAGYLPGYLREEGYRSGTRFALLTWLGSSAWVSALAVLMVIVVAVAAARHRAAEAPWHAAACVTGAALIVASPAYPWYALLLVVLVGLGARADWLAVAAAGYIAQYPDQLHLDGTLAQRLGYGLALGVVLAGWALRREVKLGRLRLAARLPGSP